MGAMSLPKPVEALWTDLQSARAEVLKEAEGLSQRQADWKPSEQDWSVGEVVHHLTIAEIATGKLTTKLTREAEAARAVAPPVVWPEHGKPIGELISTMKATRERSRQSIEKLATLDPRPLMFKHFCLGDLDLAQWWILQAQHDGVHLAQIREVKRAPGFPRG